MRNKLALTIALAGFGARHGARRRLRGRRAEHSATRREATHPALPTTPPRRPAAPAPTASTTTATASSTSKTPTAPRRPTPARSRPPAAEPPAAAAPASAAEPQPQQPAAGRAATSRPARRSTAAGRRRTATRASATPAAARRQRRRRSAPPAPPRGVQPPRPRPDGGSQYSERRLPDRANPTTTIAPFGPAPIGVPNFVIDSFEIPPFLLPIYQACGTEYGIPWQVLASINKIETAFGTNLNVSSAGAMGWMQFIPSSWEPYGARRQRRRPQGPLQPGRRDLRRRQLPEGSGGARRTSTTRSSPTTTPTGTCRRCCSTPAPTASCRPTWSAR